MSDVGEFDLDEDLFNFDEILESADRESEKVDLDELLRVLEETPPLEEPVPQPTEDDDEEIGAEEIGREDLPSQVAPVGAPAEVTAPALSSRFVRAGVAVLAGLALLNVVQIGLSWERNQDLSEALLQMESRFLLAAGDLQQDIFHQSAAMERNRLPIVAPQAAGRASLEHVQRQLEAGQFPDARRRLYSLLSVIDRYEPVAAHEVEGNATYLLADSWRLQADPPGDEQ